MTFILIIVINMMQTQNHLLQKDSVGKSKPPTRNLPGNDFYYGKPVPRDKEGAEQRKLRV